jgi:hypothetical protein
MTGHFSHAIDGTRLAVEPGDGFLGPDAFGGFLLQLGDGAEGGVIIGPLVVADTAPVDGLRGGRCRRKCIGHFAVDAFRVGPSPLFERKARQAHFELRPE